jgi:hypothetical protein
MSMRRTPRRRPRTASYQPSYFSASEYRTIDILTGLIIPKDESPGAQEAGVSEFIDFLAAHGERDSAADAYGLKWLDATAKKTLWRKLCQPLP